VALGVAAITACSYAELGSRFPNSAGEVVFCQRAFGVSWLASLIGWLVLCSGVVSSATVSHAFTGYLLAPFNDLPFWPSAATVGFLFVLAGINFTGIRFSSATNVICTLVEAGGLLFIVGAGLWYLLAGPGRLVEPVATETTWATIAQGGALAFFAFIGFEDMVNVAEEVKQPRRTMPKAIFLALSISGILYIAVVYIATRVVAPGQLAASNAPLLDVFRQTAPAIPPLLFTIVAVFAVANTGLLNFVMGSRLIYGMAQQQLLPGVLGRVHAYTRTPHWAIVVVLCLAVALSLSGTLVQLAGTTSVLILLVFLTVNLSLLFLKWRRLPSKGGFTVPWPIPMAAALASGTLIVFASLESRFAAALILLIGLVLVSVRAIAAKNR
jgi:amino acid transporter